MPSIAITKGPVAKKATPSKKAAKEVVETAKNTPVKKAKKIEVEETSSPVPAPKAASKKRSLEEGTEENENDSPNFQQLLLHYRKSTVVVEGLSSVSPVTFGGIFQSVYGIPPLFVFDAKESRKHYVVVASPAQAAAAIEIVAKPVHGVVLKASPLSSQSSKVVLTKSDDLKESVLKKFLESKVGPIKTFVMQNNKAHVEFSSGDVSILVDQEHNVDGVVLRTHYVCTNGFDDFFNVMGLSTVVLENCKATVEQIATLFKSKVGSTPVVKSHGKFRFLQFSNQEIAFKALLLTDLKINGIEVVMTYSKSTRGKLTPVRDTKKQKSN